jgi:hypothetical protein
MESDFTLLIWSPVETKLNQNHGEKRLNRKKEVNIEVETFFLDRGARSSLTIHMKFTLSRLPFFYIFFSYNFIYVRHEHRGFLQFCVNTMNERVIFCVISQENRFVSGNSDTVGDKKKRRKYLIGYYSMLISLKKNWKGRSLIRVNPQAAKTKTQNKEPSLNFVFLLYWSLKSTTKSQRYFG